MLMVVRPGAAGCGPGFIPATRPAYAYSCGGVRLKCSAFPLACDWYGLVGRCFTSGRVWENTAVMAMPALAEKPLARSQSQTAVSLGICGIEYPDQAQKFFERFENFESGWHGGSTDAVAQVEPILAFGSWRLPWHGCWVSNAPTATSARQAHTATLLSGIFVDVHAQIAMAKMPRVSAPAVPVRRV